MGVEQPPVLLPPEEEGVPLAPGGAVPLLGTAWHPGAPHGQEADRAPGGLPLLPKIYQRNGVQPHIAVVRNGQAQGALAVHHQVVVPLLDPQRPALCLVPLVDGQRLSGVSRFPQVAVLVQQRPRLGDLVLLYGFRPLSFPPIILYIFPSCNCFLAVLRKKIARIFSWRWVKSLSLFVLLADMRGNNSAIPHIGTAATCLKAPAIHWDVSQGPNSLSL